VAHRSPPVPPFSNARLLTALLAAGALGACGSGAGAGSTPSAGASSPTPSGPATADIVLAGDPALSMPLTNVSIVCLEPSFDGSFITVLGTPQGQPRGFTVFVTIRGGSVTVSVGSGGGTSLTEREFSGTGTSGFDAAKGAHLSGPLTESTPATANKGTIGVLTSISGSVSCGNQTLGTSTITVTGTTAEGAVDVTVTPARVVCRNGASGYFIGITGISSVAGTPTLVLVTLGQTSLAVGLERKAGPSHFYSSQGQVGTTVSATGGHVSGDAAEQGATGTPGTVHVTGDATCGSSATY
jgi:hypothetical protein